MAAQGDEDRTTIRLRATTTYGRSGVREDLESMRRQARHLSEPKVTIAITGVHAVCKCLLEIASQIEKAGARRRG
jgi:hypothetical protein